MYSACKLLKVFDELTTEMSAENVVTISKQNLFYIFLLEHLDTFISDINIPTNVNEMALEIKTLNKYFKNLESNDIQSQAIFLDPRFKKYGFANIEKFEACKIIMGRKLSNLDKNNSND